MTILPDPPIGRDVDLRELFSYLPLDIDQLRDSDTWTLATGDEAKACITLWCYAWHQVPAGSIPNDDRILAIKSGAFDRWEAVKSVALRGFVECSDGRLYHMELVKKALKAWAAHLERSETGRRGAANRWENKRKLDNGLARSPAISLARSLGSSPANS